MLLIQYLYCSGKIEELEIISNNQFKYKPCEACGERASKKEPLKNDCSGLTFHVKITKIDVEFIHQRLSKKQSEEQSLEGFLGNIIYDVEKYETINYLIPILKFGEHLQVGSSVNYGMGRFEIDYD